MKRLPMRKIREALRLRANGFSGRQVAQSLAVGRATISEYFRRADVEGLRWPLPADLSDAELERRLFPYSRGEARRAVPQPDWAYVHAELRRKGVTLSLLWEEYRGVHPDGYGYSRYCELYTSWEGKLSPVMRQRHPAGERLFVDYAGQTVDVICPKTGEVRTAQIFVAALGASNGSVAKFSCFQIYSQLISVLLRLIPQLVRIMAIDFKGCHYPKSVVLYAVAFYLRYPVSYRDLEEIMAERGVDIDHATLNRWVVRFSPLLADQAKLRKRPASSSWRMDETYIKVKGQWTYLYRAVDKFGKTLDFMLSERRNTKAARRFFRMAINTNGVPDKVVIDKSGANLAGLQWANVMLKFTRSNRLIEILQVKYLNNIIEQDHRFIKKITRPMLGFKAFHSASATLKGIEVSHMVRKGQIGTKGQSVFQVIAELAA